MLILLGGANLKKREFIKTSIAVIIVIGVIFSALCLFDIINKDPLPIILLIAAILNISNGYYYTNNKKVKFFSMSSGLFLIFVFVIITFS
jgi:hypothetical protein